MRRGLEAKQIRIFRFQSLGRLHHHKLDFNHKSKVRGLFTTINRHQNHFNQKWGGAVATIEEEEDSVVWGVLWQVSCVLLCVGLVWFGTYMVWYDMGSPLAGDL